MSWELIGREGTNCGVEPAVEDVEQSRKESRSVDCNDDGVDVDSSWGSKMGSWSCTWSVLGGVVLDLTCPSLRVDFTSLA